MSSTRDWADARLAEALNHAECCVAADVPALRARLEESLQWSAAERGVFDAHPHLFAAHPVFLTRAEVDEVSSSVAPC